MTLLQNLQRRLNGNKTLIVFLLVFALQCFGQTKNDYENGVLSFNRGDYSNAISYLQKFLDKKSDYTENAYLLSILSYFKLNNYSKSKELIQKFEYIFPSSNSNLILFETRLAIGIIEKNFDEIKSTLDKLNKLEIPKEKLNDYSSAFKRVFSIITPSQVNELGNHFSNPVLRFSFLRTYFQYTIERKDYNNIKKIFDELYSIGTSNSFLITNKIGVLIPSSSKSNSVEDIIKEGIKFAVHRFNNLRDKNIELKIYKGDQKYLENALFELAKDPEVLCVIGPLYSKEFKNLVLLADKLNLPLISPTATATDISLKSKFIFQFNPTLNIRGIAIGDYAINKLKVNRLALLSSDNQTLNPVISEIRKKIKSSKVELLADLKWNEKRNQITSVIKELRKAAANRDRVLRFNQLMDFETEQKLILLGMNQAKIDSLKDQEAEVSIFELFGRDAEKICQKYNLQFYKRSVSVVDNFDIPLYSLDALIIPISDDKLIADLTNEIERQNLVTQIIGNDIWNSLEELNKAYPASNGIIFTSDYYLDLEDPSIKELTKEIFEYTNLQPGRTFFYGFETANKILDNWKFDINRYNFYERIVNDKYYEGFSSDIILNNDGVNSSVYILQYKNRKIKKIERIIAD
jgi:hypothetical protein